MIMVLEPVRKRSLMYLMAMFITVCGFSQEKSEMKGLVRPPFLKKGDTIMILSPAGKVKDRTAVDPGIELANKWGLVVFFGNHLLSTDNSFAGTDAQRLEDLQKALDDPSIKAIWAARGGYGTVRIIDDLNFNSFRKNPKWIIGYSDITVLHNKLHNLGYQSIHAQMPLTLDLEDPVQKKSIKSLHRALFGKNLVYKLDSRAENKPGASNGQLVGGNLSIVYSMLASDTNLNMEGKILFIEDTGEALYHIDRMMISLKRAGYFKGCRGLIVGDFKLRENNGNPFGKTLEQIVMEAVEGTDFPVLFGFPAGHIDDNRTLIMGENIDLEVQRKKSRVSF